MSNNVERLGWDEVRAARLILIVAASYAVGSLLVQLASLSAPWRPDIPGWRVDTPVEICTALIVLGGMMFAAAQMLRHRYDLGPFSGWMFATLGLALIATSETADWFNEQAPFWNEAFWFEAPLWLLAAWCLRQCTRLYAAQAKVRAWFRVGFAIQLLAAVLDVAKDELDPRFLASADTLEVIVDYAALLCVVCYLSALLLTRTASSAAGLAARLSATRPPVFAGAGVLAPRALAPVDIGVLARRLYVEQRMFRAARYPTRYPILHRTGLRQTVTVVMAAVFGGRLAARVEAAGCRWRLRQYADLLRLGIGQGIDAVSYYLYELYRPGGRTEAPYYLTRYETKNGLLTVLNAPHDRSGAVPFNLTDKSVFADACGRAGIPTPPIYLTAVDGVAHRHVADPVFDRDLFAKLKRGRGTMKTGLFHRVDFLRYVDRQGRHLSLAEIVEQVREQSLTVVGVKTTPVIIQPRLRNHPSIADLAQDSLIVFRVVTCLDAAGRPEVTHALLRVLTKIEPAWDTHPDTEYGAAIDLETGQLGRMTGDKPDTCLDWYDVHPITGAPVLGRRIDAWPALRDLALRAHAVFSSRIVIGWDIALTEEGPMLIEGNSNMDVSFIQRAYRDPIGRTRLGELLGYHLRHLACGASPADSQQR